jgi:plasmid stabilization system protein ParE
VKVSYRQAASDDVVRQFPYYLVTLSVPEVAIRFQDAVRNTVQSLCQHPFAGPRCRSRNPHLQNLRLWPVAGFEAIRIYYVAAETSSASFGFFTASEMLCASWDVSRPSDQ